MAGLIERSLLLGMGVLTLTRDRVREVVDRLVEEGEVSREEAPGIVDRLLQRGEAEREELRKLVRQELDRVTPASRQDVEEVTRKIDELAAQVEELTAKDAPKKQGA